MIGQHLNTCDSERREESTVLGFGAKRFLASLGMTIRRGFTLTVHSKGSEWDLSQPPTANDQPTTK